MTNLIYKKDGTSYSGAFLHSESGSEVIIAATGDSMITRKLSPYTEEEYLDMVKILRGADVATTNVEGMIHNFEGYFYKPYDFGTPMRAPPFAANELRWMGFNIVSTANNHSMDYSEESMLAMFKILDAAGLPHAGMGRDLADARMPTYLETKKGRVALIGASEINDITAQADREQAAYPWTMAGYAAQGVCGRPGVNGIRIDATYIVSREAIDELRKIRESLKIRAPRFFGGDTPLREKAEEEDELIFLNKRFKVGERPDILLVPKAVDVEANLREIRGAKKQADWVLFQFHSHASDVDPEMPAPFMRKFAKDCIDAGADAFIGHGHHNGCGLEIYKGKPIIYSLGTFIMQAETLDQASSRLLREVWEC